ncbi:DUF4167 domain-containing protein [Bartonella sp. B35(2025)]
MRPQQNRRVRGRNNNSNNNNNRRGPNPLSRNYESSGPDVKIRGNAQQIADKYISLARDAQGAGDRVMSENYLQHAEHYLRIILAAVGQMSHRRDENNDQDCDELNVEGTKRDDANCDNSVSQTQQRKNSNDQQTKVQNGYISDGLVTNCLLDENANQQQCIPEERTEIVKKPRRAPRQRVARIQEESSRELSQVMPDVSENGDALQEGISTKKTTSLALSDETSSTLLGEEVQKKPRRRRVATSSAEGNV